MELELCELERAELAELELGRTARTARTGPNRTAPTSLLGSFWEPFWSHFGSHFGVILGAILNSFWSPGGPEGLGRPTEKPGRPRSGHFSSFWEPLAEKMCFSCRRDANSEKTIEKKRRFSQHRKTAKIVVSCRRQLNFHVLKHAKYRFFRKVENLILGLACRRELNFHVFFMQIKKIQKNPVMRVFEGCPTPNACFYKKSL